MKRIFLALVFITLPYHLFHSTYPLLDAFNFRQTQTATFALNMYKHGFNFSRTELDIFGVGKEKYLTLEFPFYEAMVASLDHLWFANEIWGRLVTIAAGYIGAWYLYQLVRFVTGMRKIAMLSAVFFLIVPLNLFYQRTVMIDPTIIACLLVGTYYAITWVTSQKLSHYAAGLVFLTLGFIQKGLYGPFWLLPIGVYFLKKRKDIRTNYRPIRSFLCLAGVPLVALFLWQRHIDLQNIQNGQFFFTTQNAGHLDWNFGTWSDRFSPALWRQLLHQLLNGIFLKPGLFLFIIGCFSLRRVDRWWFLQSFLLSQLLYMVIVFRIQVQNYYQLVMIPAIVPVMALGLLVFVSWLVPGKHLRAATVSMILVFFLWRSWVGVQPSFTIDWSWLRRIQAIEKVTPPGSVGIFAVAGTEWNSAFTYYSHRILKRVAIETVTPDQVGAWRKEGYSFIILYAKEQYPQYLQQVKARQTPNFVFSYPRLLENQEFSVYQLGNSASSSAAL